MSRHHPISTLFPYTTLFRSSNSRDSPRCNVICLASLSSGLTLSQTSSSGAVSCTRIAPAGVSGVGLGVGDAVAPGGLEDRSEEHTSELQSLRHLVCRLLLEK